MKAEQIRQVLAPFIRDDNYRQNRYAVVDNKETDYSEGADIVAYCETFDDAVKKWEALMAEHPQGDYSITGWGAGTLAFHMDVRNLFAAPRGTFECPICFKDTPHEHSGEQVADHRIWQAEEQAIHEEKRKEILERIASIEQNSGQRPRLDAAVVAMEAALSHSAEGDSK